MDTNFYDVISLGWWSQLVLIDVIG